MNAYDKFLEDCIEDSKQAKKDSREQTIWILEHFDELAEKLENGDEGVYELLECGKQYRRWEDDNIKGWKEELKERKEA